MNIDCIAFSRNELYRTRPCACHCDRFTAMSRIICSCQWHLEGDCLFGGRVLHQYHSEHQWICYDVQMKSRAYSGPWRWCHPRSRKGDPCVPKWQSSALRRKIWRYKHHSSSVRRQRIREAPGACYNAGAYKDYSSILRWFRWRNMDGLFFVERPIKARVISRHFQWHQ